MYLSTASSQGFYDESLVKQLRLWSGGFSLVSLTLNTSLLSHTLQVSYKVLQSTIQKHLNSNTKVIFWLKNACQYPEKMAKVPAADDITNIICILIKLTLKFQ